MRVPTLKFRGTSSVGRISYPSGGDPLGHLYHVSRPDHLRTDQHRCERITIRGSRCRSKAYWRTHDGHFVCDRRDHIQSKRGWW